MVIKVMVADDQALIRESLKLFCQPTPISKWWPQWKMGITSCRAFRRHILT